MVVVSLYVFVHLKVWAVLMIFYLYTLHENNEAKFLILLHDIFILT